MLFLNVPYAQMKVILVLIVFIDHKKRNLDTNECLFSVNEQQKVYLEYGRHVARLRRRRRRRRRRTYAPASNTASHDNHEKINSWVSFSFLYEYGAPLKI